MIQQAFISVPPNDSTDANELVQGLQLAIGMRTLQVEDSNKHFGKIECNENQIYVAVEHRNHDKQQYHLGYICGASFGSKGRPTLEDFVQAGKLLFDEATNTADTIKKFYPHFRLHVMTLPPHQIHEGAGVFRQFFDFAETKYGVLTMDPKVLRFCLKLFIL